MWAIRLRSPAATYGEMLINLAKFCSLRSKIIEIYGKEKK